MKLAKLVYACIGLSMLPISNASAGTMGPVDVDSRHYFFTIGLGALWADNNANEQIQLFPEIVKTYVNNGNNDPALNGELFGGLAYDFSGYQLGLGLAVAVNTSVKLTGDIWEDSDPAFDNYIYHYNLRSTRFSVKGKASREVYNGIGPFITASIGAAMNDAHHYGETPKIEQEVIHPYFANHTTTSLTYAFGIGLQKAVNENFQVGIGYEYANLGNVSLGRATGQVLGSGISLSNLSTNSAMLYLTYSS